MPDNDIRTRLADALSAAIRHDLHAPVPVPAAVIAEHLVDVLLALPGIAVVKVPAGDLWDVIDMLIEFAGPRAFAADSDGV
jgi:hypothetical protein